MGITRRGPPESCIIARSTLQVTTSPGATNVRPAARAMIFCERVWGVSGLFNEAIANGRLTSNRMRNYHPFAFVE